MIGRSLLVGLGLVALFVALILGVGVGTVAINPADTIAILGHRFLGLDIPKTWSDATETIVVDLRLPRVLTAMLVGCALAVAGTTFQGLLRNPLADPYVLGTASGAALGAAIAVHHPRPLRHPRVRAASKASRSSAPSPRSRRCTSCRRTNGLAPMTSLLLTGYAVGSLLAAGLAMAMYVSGAALRQIFTYLLGSFDAATLAALPGDAADHPHRERRDHAPGAVAQRAAARRAGGRAPRHRRPPRARGSCSGSPRS